MNGPHSALLQFGYQCKALDSHPCFSRGNRFAVDSSDRKKILDGAKIMPTNKRASDGGQETVHKVMHEYKIGALKSGSGDKVKSRDQAVAIAMSEARDTQGKAAKKKAKS